jgi:hypothetical protein
MLEFSHGDYYAQGAAIMVRLVLICGGWIVDREARLLCLLSALVRPIGWRPLNHLPFHPTKSTRQGCNIERSEKINDTVPSTV